jgi:hypothetical protein
VNLKIVAAVAALGTFGVLTASAASLGGLTSTSLGADETVVAACDADGIALTYANGYDTATSSYRTTAVTMSGVAAACADKSFRLTLSNGISPLSEVTDVVTPTAGVFTVTLPSSIDAKSVAQVALVITG